MNRILCILLSVEMAFAIFQTASAESAIYNVRDYGAAGDGKTLDTRAIQAAVDKCTEAGGGRVVLDKGGTFLSGTVFLKSNVTLYIESGTVLLGSTDIADYPVTKSALRTYTENYTDKSLIYAEKQQNISILGRGKIDGQGRTKSFRGKSFKQMPYLMRIVECNNVTVRDVTLSYSAMWMQHYLACDDVLVDGITVENGGAWVADGIDIDSCHRVRIANSSFESTDDGICLKTTTPRSCEDVTVVNCKVKSVANCFKIGTETSGDFKNISLSNCTFSGSKLAGIALQAVDGGVIEKVRISDVTMQNCKCPIFFRLGNRGRPYLALGKGSAGGGWRLPEGVKMDKMPGVGALRDVIIRNIQASDAGIGEKKLGRDGCCSITGITNHPVENIILENISIKYKGGESGFDPQRKVPEVANSYPEQNMFGVLPAYGLFLRHVRGLEIKNFQVGFEANDLRPVMVAVDVAGLKISDFKAQVADGVDPSRFEDVKDLVITNSPVLEKKRGIANTGPRGQNR